MNNGELIAYIENGGADAVFERLYGAGSAGGQRKRYTDAIKEFTLLYGQRQVSLFSVPGRIEVCGNHTDHQRGRVIAAAVDLDIIAVASERDDGQIRIKSKGFPEDRVNCRPDGPDESLRFTSASLISGVCAGFLDRGFRTVGFDAYTTSSVLKGSGISSSAAFEDMVGNILNHFANRGEVTAPVIAEISKYAENVYFGKPSGLMDQTACAVGGFCYIDFADPRAAEIEKLSFSLTDAKYSLCITNTGGNHADLNEDYASVPADMLKVAGVLGREVLRGATLEELTERAADIRAKCGDRALLRAYHFITENDRVAMQAENLKKGDVNAFLDGINASGRSSFMWLQNVYTVKNPQEQGLSAALMMSEELLSGTSRKSAWRVHGGGFAGTVQAFVPDEEVGRYRDGMEMVFGKDSCAVLKIRQDGAIKIL
ncbi:MAG: galactokinase [Clostridia bacterium]|nr:galactokinase [Clostridia bacterium]